MKIGKLDRRHNGHLQFKYYARFLTISMDQFCEVRNWCWQTWGPSAELDTIRYLEYGKDLKWAWICDQYNVKIYLATDKEYQWFTLKWK